MNGVGRSVCGHVEERLARVQAAHVIPAGGFSYLGLFSDERTRCCRATVRPVNSREQRGLGGAIQNWDASDVLFMAQVSYARSGSYAVCVCALMLLRCRYVHSRTTPVSEGRGGKGGDVEAGVEVERRYGKIYDEGINPFKEFKDQQKERQKSAMGFVDKVIL